MSILLTGCGGGGGEPELNNAIAPEESLPAIPEAPDGVTSILGSGPIVADGVSVSSVNIRLFDGDQNPIVGVTPTFSATDTGSQNTYNACTPSDNEGLSICSFSSTRAETKTLQLDSPQSVSGNNVTFVAGSADHITLVNTLSSSAQAGQAFATQPIFELRDQFENIVTTSNYSLGLSPFTDSGCSTPGTGGLTATSNPITNGGTNGVFTFANLNYTQTGSLYLRTNATGDNPALPSLCLGPITINNSANFHLSFSTQPSANAIAGQNFSTLPTIEILDDFNNLPTSAPETTASITINAYTDSACSSLASGSLQGTTSANASGGVLINPSLNYTRAETIYLGASSSGMTSACSDAIAVSAAAPDAANSSITGTGPVAANGFHFSAISISLFDAFNNPISGVTPSFTATNSGSDNTSTSCSVTDTSGVSTCELRSLTPEAKTLLLLSPVTKADGVVNFITPPSTAFTTITGTTALANSSDTSVITVNLRDATDSPVVGLTPTFTATDTGSDNQLDSCTVSDASGVSTCGLRSSTIEVKNLTITSPLNNFTGGTAEFVAPPENATQLVFTQQPSNAGVSENISPSIQVEIRDNSNNLVASATNSVTLSLNNDPSSGSATLAGTLTVAAISGVATFSNINLDEVASGYTLSASSTGLTSATSSSFDIENSVATQLVFIQNPSDTQAGSSITPSITVEFRDALNNLVSSETSNVTLALSTDPSSGSATLSGTLTQAAVGGVATFNDISLDQAFNGYILEASSGSLSNAVSTSFNILPGPATQLSFVTQPSDANINDLISPAVTVEFRDALNNLVISETSTITLSLANDPSSGSATFAGTLTQSATGGTATFSDISLDTQGLGYSLNASSGALPVITSSSFNILERPEITSFIEPVDGTFASGGQILFQVNFDENVTVAGTPRLSLNVGGATRFADYISGSGGQGIEFEYIVQAGDNDADGITMNSTSIDLNGGNITASSDGDAAALEFSSFLDSLTGVLVDTSSGQSAPDQVTNVSTAPTVNNTELAVNWAIPNNNGTAIVSYNLQYREQGQSTWLNLSPAPTINEAVIGGLTSGVTYEIRVAANNGLLGPYSAISTAEIFDVLSLNPVAWLSSTNITNGGSEPNNGDSIATWSDLTGAATDATEADSTRQPIYTTNVQNGLPAVRFDNLDRGLEGTFNRANGTDLTFVIVGQFDTGSNNKALFEFNGGGNARGFFIDQRYAGNSNFSPDLTRGSFNLWRIEDAGGSAIVTENSVTSLFNGNTNFNTDFVGTGNYVLGDDTTGGNRLNGFIGEFLIFDRALTASEINTLETYLKNKWDLP